MNTEWCKNTIGQAVEQAHNTKQQVIAYDQKHNSILTVIGLTAVIATVAGVVAKLLVTKKNDPAKAAEKSRKKFKKDMKNLVNSSKELTVDQLEVIKNYVTEASAEAKDKAVAAGKETLKEGQAAVKEKLSK